MVSLFIASCPYIPLTESMIGEPRTNPLEWSKWKLGEIAGGLHPPKNSWYSHQRRMGSMKPLDRPAGQNGVGVKSGLSYSHGESQHGHFGRWLQAAVIDEIFSVRAGVVDDEAELFVILSYQASIVHELCTVWIAIS